MEFNSEQLWSLVKPRLRSYQELHNWDVVLVAQVTGSTTKTVMGWLDGQTPNGERLIKLWHLLAALGLESPELSKLPALNRYCGELLTFGVITMKEVQEICHVANPQSGLMMLRGKPSLRPQVNFEELTELHGDDLQSRRSELTSVISQPESGPERTEPPAGAPSSASSKDEYLIVYAASMLKGVLPLVRQLNSEQCSAADRSRLRSLVGNDDMFDLSNTLNNLCSERAREQGRSGKR